MKPNRLALSLVLLVLATTAALAQSDAQKSFDSLKSLAGTWQATYEGKPMQATLRVTSMGNAILHEMKGEGPDNPITMFYLDGDRLLLTHYCDAGNRPRMAGKLSPDGKTLEVDFVDVGNDSATQGGHMQHAVVIIIDANQHPEEGTLRQEQQ